MIIDAHHHIWRRDDLPWLLGPMQPRIFGPYEAIRRDYPLTEYLQDCSGCGVTGSVYVQANWAPGREYAEAAWVQSVADAHGWPHAIVACTDLTAPDAADRLRELARIPLVRGIRQQMHWHENPSYRFAARADLVCDPAVRRSVARLEEYGWCFDLQVFPGQMRHAAELVRSCPGVTFVLQHAGMPENRSAAGRAEWLDGMRRLAGFPNMVCKLSGLGTFIHRNDPHHVAEVVGQTLDIFGAGRAMFGSNFPIEKLWTGYGPLLDAYRAATSGLPAAARRAIFHDTAVRVYRPAPNRSRGNDNGT